MIGELFTINRDNIVRAAIAEVTKDLMPSDPVEVTARPHENDVDALILVAGSDGDAFEIVVRESTVAEIRQLVDEVLG